MITLQVISPQHAMIFKDVRLGALKDAPSAFSSTYAEEAQLTDADWIARAAQWNDDGSAAYLAMDAGNPCGIAAGFIDEDDRRRAHLASMWVAPAYRRAGIGRRLVDAIILWASAQRVHTLLLMVTSNNDPAIGFYQRLGFTMTGRSEPYANDHALLDFEMARSLS